MRPRGAAVGWVIFGAALALRVGWVIFRWVRDGPAFEFDDERLHWELASNLVQNGELVSADGRYAARMPIYPLWLALFAGLGQAGVLVARLGQALLGALSTLVAYRLARAALGARAALVAGLLVCLDPYAIFFANLLLTEVPFILIGLGFVACAWHAAARSDRPSRAAVAGVALLGAAALLTRPSSAGWIVLVWLLLWVAGRGRRGGVARVVIYVATLAVCLLPWGIRNRAVLGSFAWLSTNGGVTLYDAQGPQADGSSNQAFLEAMPELAGLDEVQRDRTLRRLAIEQMKQNPGRVLRLAAVKLRRTWNPVPNVREYRGGFAALGSAVFTGLVLVLAGVGVVRTVWTRRRDVLKEELLYHVLLWLPVVYFTLVHCVFIGSLRYRVPLMPLLVLVGAAAFQRPRDRRSRL